MKKRAMNVIPAPVIYWSQLVCDIEAAGASLAGTSLKLGHAKCFLANVKSGFVSRPKYDDGVRLLELHQRLCSPDQHKALFKEIEVQGE